MTQTRRAAAEANAAATLNTGCRRREHHLDGYMAIPVDAPHPDYAYASSNFVMRPANMAAITNSNRLSDRQCQARSIVMPP